MLLGAVAFAGCHGPGAGEQILVRDDFQAGLEDWALRHGADGATPVPTPTPPVYEAGWNVSVSKTQVHVGNHSIRFETLGEVEPAAIWITRSVPVVAGASYSAELSAAAWSPGARDPAMARLLLYLGTDDPVDPRVFGGAEGQANAAALREPLDQQEGWREYSASIELARSETGLFHIALGIDPVGDGALVYHLDDVRVRFDPVE